MNNFFTFELNPHRLLVYIGEIYKVDNYFHLTTASILPKTRKDEPINDLAKLYPLYCGRVAITKDAFVTKCDENWDGYGEIVHKKLYLHYEIDKKTIYVCGIMEYKKEVIEVNTCDKLAVKMYESEDFYALWDYLHE